MYEISDINELLSPSIKSVLKDAAAFAEFEMQASIIAKNNVSIDLTIPPTWVKQPFVWVLEYLVSAKLSSISSEYLKIIQDHYKEAIRMLNKQGTVGNVITTSRIGAMHGMWEV